eukprot:2219735-Karenia_brevis.AAC.1
MGLQSADADHPSVWPGACDCTPHDCDTPPTAACSSECWNVPHISDRRCRVLHYPCNGKHECAYQGQPRCQHLPLTDTKRPCRQCSSLRSAALLASKRQLAPPRGFGRALTDSTAETPLV